MGTAPAAKGDVMSGLRTATRRVLNTAMALVAVSALALACAQAASAAPDPPNTIGFTLEGCDNPGGLSFPDANGNYVCDNALYGTGNMGKNWSEFDLVPFRVTTDAGAGGPGTDYSIAISVVAEDNGTPGYDFISEATVNDALSDDSCAISSGAEQVTGTTEKTRYRIVTISQDPGTTCVFDYYARLAIGASDFPGASLHSNLYNQNLGESGVGKKAVSINPREVAPQELDKDMTATQDSDHVWNVTKAPTPASVDFADTCDPDAADRQAAVSIEIEWTKLPATPSGEIMVVTNIYAINPASRTISVTVDDDIYSGTTLLNHFDHTAMTPVEVEANTQELVKTHVFSVPAGTTDLNDVATGHYVDTVTGIPIPQTTTATATSGPIQAGSTLNTSATINDLESITGAGYTFSADSFSGATGAFDLGYLPGTPTAGNVSWTSTSQTSSGSATFAKTIYVAQGTVNGGKLSDTATLTGSDGFTTDADLDIDITASAKVALTITKNIPAGILQAGESQTFTFDVVDSNGDPVASPTITFGPGESTDAVTLTGLDPDTYTVSERQEDGWSLVPEPQAANINLPACSGGVEFTNSFLPAVAQAVKVTQPAGGTLADGWAMKLEGPGAGVNGETVSTVNGTAAFTTTLQEGTYTITETLKSGWDQVSASGCSFTVAYPRDNGETFTCTITNRQRGHIIVAKQTLPDGSSQSFEFDPSYGSNFFLSDGQSNDSGAIVADTYSVAEVNVPAGWDLTSATCSDGSPITAIVLGAGETVTCTFNNRQRGHIIVEKQTLPDGSSQTFEFDTSYGSNFFLTDGQTNDSGALVPGTYSADEVNVPAGWDRAGSTCSDGSPVTGIVLGAGETVTCTFNNRQRGTARVIKTVDGAAPSGIQALTFQLRQGATTISDGTVVETLVANALNGGVLNFTTTLIPGQTYQLCEIIMPGWTSTFGTFVPGSFMPPGGVPNTNVDNSILCGNFTVTAGELKVFTVDNSPPPGGRALTIGFWKNWSSCSGGKQRPVLEETLASFPIAAGQTTHGVFIGSVYVDTCLEAVALLNKSDLSGKKLASDPLYNLAAQLLATELNFQAGAGKCGAAVTAQTQAQTLLANYSFNGTGTYAKKLSKADTTRANQLANTLDRYNNNNLCV